MVTFSKQPFAFLWMFLVLSTDSVISEELKRNDISTNNAIVVFDPYVSILDKYNRFRYNQTDLLPLIETVSSKFQRVCVQLSQFDMDEGLKTSMSLVPEAVAHFNNKSAKMEVWLQYAASIQDYDYHDNVSYHKDPLILINRLNSLAGKSNQLFNDTVTTNLLPYKLLSNFIAAIQHYNITLKSLFTNVKKWGFVVDYDTMITYYSNVFKELNLLRPDVVLYSLLPVGNEEQFLSRMERSIQYEKMYSKFSSFGRVLTIPDTDINGKSNMSSTLLIWNQAMLWSLSKTMVLSKAFDTPYEDSIDRKTSGWWRLLEDPTYNSTNDYKFIEKSDIHKSNLNADNLNWPPEKLNVSKEHVAIILSLYDQQRAKTSNEPPAADMADLLDQVASLFRKIVILVHDDSPNGRKIVRYEVALIKRSRHKFEVTVLFLPRVHPSELLKGVGLPTSQINMILNMYLETLDAFIFPFVGNETNKEVNYFRNHILTSADITNYSFGYTFNISLCVSFDKLSTYDKDLFVQYISAHEVTRIIIFFEEFEENTKLGTERIFNQTIVLFAQCQKFLVEQIKIREDLQISYMMLHYGTSSKFYESKFAIKNFIEYWQKLSDWAKRENTTVILNSAVDVDRRFETRNEYMHEIGWWKYQDGDVDSRMPSPNGRKNTFIDKIEYLKVRFPRQTAADDMQTYQLILVIVIPIIMFALVVIAALGWMRQAYSDNVLTKTEVNEFFKGREHHNNQSEEGTIENTIQRVPYDKDRYEVSPDEFTIYTDKTLGSGEFGKVFKGKVIKLDTGAKYVAVKTMNPHPNKVRVNGFLTEIKLLSHLGEHENIIKLFGANTQDIRIGRVYIFLELCELGSLDKYLRRMRSQAEEMAHDMRQLSEDAVGNSGYADVRIARNPLDESLIQYMYQWSRDICNGMAYLVSKHVVHADLATRNVLLNSEKVAKICDFGLSSRLYNYKTYAKRMEGMLPWKWISPESLRLLKFNEKSDVWAYGVTLWEIYTLGDEPYAGITYNLSFVEMLDDGERLTEPKYNDENDMFSVMKRCWHIIPKNRPTFAELIQNTFITD